MVDFWTVVYIIIIAIGFAPVWVPIVVVVVVAAGYVALGVLAIPVVIVSAFCQLAVALFECLFPPTDDSNQHQDLPEFRSQVNAPQEQALPQERSDFIENALHSRTLQEGDSVRFIPTNVIADDDSQEEQGGAAASIRNVVESSTATIVESVRSAVGPKQECSICLVAYKQGDTVCWAKSDECNHMYHDTCITQWLENHDDCPLCRTKLLDHEE